MLTLYDVPLIMSSQPELCGHLLVPRGWPHINAGGAMTRRGGGGGGGVHQGWRHCSIELFFKRYLISVILILMCCIAVSSALRFVVFQANYSVKEDHSRKVLRYRSFALSCPMQVNIGTL